MRKRQANRTWGDIAQSAVRFVGRNSAIYRTHPQSGSEDSSTVLLSFEPPCGCVRQIAELRPTKPTADCAISPHVRFACLFLNPTPMTHPYPCTLNVCTHFTSTAREHRASSYSCAHCTASGMLADKHARNDQSRIIRSVLTCWVWVTQHNMNTTLV